MNDPALKNSLSGQDIENLAKAADFGIVQKTTPGLTPLTRTDWWFFWGIFFGVSGLFYIDSNIRPFLPFRLPSVFIPFVPVIFYVTIAVGIIAILGLLASFAYGGGVYV